MFDPALIESRPWLIEPSRFHGLLARVLKVKSCPTARELASERRRRLEAASLSAGAAIRSTKGKIGIIPCWGPVGQRLTSELDKSGGTACEEMGAALDAMLADPSIDAIVMHFDSPGGTSYGVEELSDKIFAARQQKKMYASVDSMACSAAYWLASSCETICVTPGGDVGSVGVYTFHVDASKAYEEKGLKITFVQAGKFKTEFKDTEPLAAEAQAWLQADVDAVYQKFVKAVARNRGVTVAEVKAKYGEGRVVACDMALETGMADRKLSFDDLLGKLLGRESGGGGGRKASVELAKLRAQREKTMSYDREES